MAPSWYYAKKKAISWGKGAPKNTEKVNTDILLFLIMSASLSFHQGTGRKER